MNTEQIDPVRVMRSIPICTTQEDADFHSEAVTFENLQIGDFVRPQSWSRPRAIVAKEEDSTGMVYFLADPDLSLPRRLDMQLFHSRSNWVVFPELSKLWRAYQPTPEVLPMAPEATGEVGTRKPFGGLL